MPNEARTIATKYVDTYTSFSGTDMVCIFELPLSGGNAVTGVVGSVKTISYSVHNEKSPVRILGNMNAIAYVYDNRTIAGSLVFQVFDKHWMLKLLEKWLEKEGKGKVHALSDELPPINITIAMANEYGDKARLALYGVTFVNEGQVMSIEDFYTENTYEFFALDIDYLNQEGYSLGSGYSKLDTLEEETTRTTNSNIIDRPYKILTAQENDDEKEKPIEDSLEEIVWDKDEKKGSWWNLKTKRITGIAAGLAGLIALLRHHKKKPKTKKEEPMQEKPTQEQNKWDKFDIPDANDIDWWQQQQIDFGKPDIVNQAKKEQEKSNEQKIAINKIVCKKQYQKAYDAYIRAGKFDNDNFQKVLHECCKIKWGDFKIATAKEQEEAQKEVIAWIESEEKKKNKIKNKEVLTPKFLTKETSETNTEDIIFKEDVKEEIKNKAISFLPISKQIPVNYPNIYKYAINETVLALLNDRVLNKDKAEAILSQEKQNINSYMIDAANDMRALLQNKNKINTLYPLTFIRQLPDGVLIKNNEFNNGYTTIKYYDAVHPEDEFSVETESDTIEIHNLLNPGLYIFYAEDKNNQTTAECATYIMLASTMFFIEQLKKYIHNVSELDNFTIENSDTLIKPNLYKTESLINLYKDIKDVTEEEKQSYYYIISNAERYENIQTINMNHALEDTSIIYNKNKILITVPLNITHIDVIDRTTNTIVEHKIKEQTLELKCKENTLYYIDLYNNENLLGRLLHYQFDNETISKNKSETFDNTNLLTDSAFPTYGISLSDSDKQSILYERKYEVKNTIVPRVLAEEGIINKTVAIEIQNFNILQNLDKTVYLVGKEYDSINNNLFNRAIPVTSSHMIYNLYENNLMGDVVFYIADEHGIILSDFTKYSEDENQYDYEYNKSMLEIEEYVQSLLNKLNDFESYQEAKMLIQDELEEEKQYAFPSVNKCFKNILNRIIHTNTIIVNKNKLLYIVLTHYFANFDYAYDLFNSLTININNYNKSVDIPKGNHNYEIVQLGFNVGSSSFTTSTYKASKDYAVRLRYDEYDYNLYYCIDTETYKKSGFIFFGNIKNDLFRASNLYDIKET